MRKLFSRTTCAGAALILLAACSTYGGSPNDALIRVDILGSGVESEAYLVPKEVWDNEAAALQRDRERLARYSVGRVPKSNLRVRARRYVVVWRCAGDLRSDQFSPEPGGRNQFVALCTE